jgi:cytochrome c oxidase cbb3-type subunit I/II
MYWTRLGGGLMYLTGFLVMAWNLVMTARSGQLSDEEVEFVELAPAAKPYPWQEIAFGKPVILALVIATLFALFPFEDAIANVMLIALVIGIGVLGGLILHAHAEGKPTWHALIEGRALWFSGFTVIAVLIGGVAELVPSIVTGSEALARTSTQPYRALELEGRDVYLREGCYNCHSQMIRPFAWESARYGEVSQADDSIFDHPFQWGSKRTGPDLSRVGGKYNHEWHYRHLLDPREISPGSNMPPYPHLKSRSIDFGQTADKLRAMRAVGVPYKPEQIGGAARDAEAQAGEIAAQLVQAGERNVVANSELVALISYLQRLGKPNQAAPAAPGVRVSMHSGSNAGAGAQATQGGE